MAVRGSKALIDALMSLDEAVRKRITWGALKAAGEPIRQQAEINVQPISQTISDSIDVQKKSYRKGVVIVLKIGPGTDPGHWRTSRIANPFTGNKGARIHKPEKTAHLVEGGTQPHTIKIGKLTIKHPGTDAQPFLKPAREAHEDRAFGIFEATAWRLIERHARREARKAAKAAAGDG